MNKSNWYEYAIIKSIKSTKSFPIRLIILFSKNRSKNKYEILFLNTKQNT